MARIAIAWELGGRTGHVSTLLPVARELRQRGHVVRLVLRHPDAAADLDPSGGISREPAPFWTGPSLAPAPANWGEILLNFGYHDADAAGRLIGAWRERLASTDVVLANAAPAAHLAARTLGLPSFELAQGYHVPPDAWPSPPLRDWEPVPAARLEAADRRVLEAINPVLAAYGAERLGTIGQLFAGRTMLLTYPELDVYPSRGPAEYFGITDTAEGAAVPPWPEGSGPRIFAYVYPDYERLELLLAAIAGLEAPTLLFCRGMEPALRERYGGTDGAGALHISQEPLRVSQCLPQADLVVCHGSHQTSAQALIAGKPLLLLPTQLEQFLITRRVVRHGAGLGIAPEAARPDFELAVASLIENGAYGARAREFRSRYQTHSRKAAMDTIILRCEAAAG